MRTYPDLVLGHPLTTVLALNIALLVRLQLGSDITEVTVQSVNLGNHNDRKYNNFKLIFTAI